MHAASDFSSFIHSCCQNLIYTSTKHRSRDISPSIVQFTTYLEIHSHTPQNFTHKTSPLPLPTCRHLTKMRSPPWTLTGPRSLCFLPQYGEAHRHQPRPREMPVRLCKRVTRQPGHVLREQVVRDRALLPLSYPHCLHQRFPGFFKAITFAVRWFLIMACVFLFGFGLGVLVVMPALYMLFAGPPYRYVSTMALLCV